MGILLILGRVTVVPFSDSVIRFRAMPAGKVNPLGTKDPHWSNGGGLGKDEGKLHVGPITLATAKNDLILLTEI